jgi:adenylyl cyclase-associated protein
MSGGLHSLATIIKRYIMYVWFTVSCAHILQRLEAATSRLEDMASVGQYPQATTTDDDLGLKDVPSPVTAASASAPAPPPPPPAIATQENAKSVTAYDEHIINGSLSQFLDLTRGFAGEAVIEIVRCHSIF